MIVTRTLTALMLAIVVNALTPLNAAAAVVPAMSSRQFADIQTAVSKPALTSAQQQQLLALERQLTPAQLARLQPGIRFVHDVLTGQVSGDPLALAKGTVAAAFPGATPANANALLCIVVAEAATGAQVDLKTVTDKLQALNAGTQTPGTTTQEQQLQTQLLQSQYTQVMQAISNLLKSMSDTQNAIISNLKG